MILMSRRPRSGDPRTTAASSLRCGTCSRPTTNRHRRSQGPYDNILYETNDRVATVTLNRPEKLNALSNELRGEMFHALKTAEADSSIGVVIIKGTGRAFSAGSDLQAPRTLVSLWAARRMTFSVVSSLQVTSGGCLTFKYPRRPARGRARGTARLASSFARTFGSGGAAPPARPRARCGQAHGGLAVLPSCE